MAKGNIFQVQRTALGLTQKDVANQMGITQVQYQQYETKKHRPGPTNIKKLSEALEIPEAIVLNFFN